MGIFRYPLYPRDSTGNATVAKSCNFSSSDIVMQTVLGYKLLISPFAGISTSKMEGASSDWTEGAMGGRGQGGKGANRALFE